jgi:hypothetical protein
MRGGARVAKQRGWLGGLVVVVLALALTAVCCGVNVELGVSPRLDAADARDDAPDAAD